MVSPFLDTPRSRLAIFTFQFYDGGANFITRRKFKKYIGKMQ